MDEGRRRFLDETALCRTIALDTSACIYYLDEQMPFVELVDPLIRRASSGSLRIVLSAIVQLELLVRPYRIGDKRLLRQALQFTEEHPGITTMNVSRDVVFRSAQVRAKWGLKLPDATIVGSAVAAGAHAIVGNDAGFSRLKTAPAPDALTASLPPLPPFLKLDEYAVAE